MIDDFLDFTNPILPLKYELLTIKGELPFNVDVGLPLTPLKSVDTFDIVVKKHGELVSSVLAGANYEFELKLLKKRGFDV